jgi:hypothetical protein
MAVEKDKEIKRCELSLGCRTLLSGPALWEEDQIEDSLVVIITISCSNSFTRVSANMHANGTCLGTRIQCMLEASAGAAEAQPDCAWSLFYSSLPQL